MLDELNGNILETAAETAKSGLKTVKHTVGQIVRTPGEIAEGLSLTAKGIGKGVGSTAGAIPIVLIIAAIGVAGFLLFMGRAGKNVVPTPGFKVGESYPELLGRIYSRKSMRKKYH